MLLNKSFEASRLNVLEAVSPVSLLVEEPYRAEKQISRRGSHTARGRERERERERARERERHYPAGAMPNKNGVKECASEEGACSSF